MAGRPPSGALKTFSTPPLPLPLTPPPPNENLKSGPAAAMANNSAAAEDGVVTGAAGVGCPDCPGLGSLKLVNTAWGSALASACPSTPFPGI